MQKFLLQISILACKNKMFLRFHFSVEISSFENLILKLANDSPKNKKSFL